MDGSNGAGWAHVIQETVGKKDGRTNATIVRKDSIKTKTIINKQVAKVAPSVGIRDGKAKVIVYLAKKDHTMDSLEELTSHSVYRALPVGTMMLP